MNKQFGSVILVIVLLVGGFYLFNSGNGGEESMMMKEGGEKEMMEEKDMMEKENMEKDMMDKDMSDSSMKKDEMAKASGSYEVYSAEKTQMAEDGKVVLFFKANWCPSCRAADTAIKNNLTDIPSDVTILEVDYDQSADLKKKYGVTSQHTFVQVDAKGELLKKWSGGLTLDSILGNII